MRPLLRIGRGELLGLKALSVVIPVLDAGHLLRERLNELKGVGEVVVVDGGSTDDSIAVAEDMGARLVIAPRGRGVQLKAGADAADGASLLFLHADTRLGDGWRGAVEKHMTDAPHKAACFRLRLDDSAWQARAIERGVALRVRLLGLPYGDQGLLVSRSLYNAAGGFRPMPLMEDVDLVRRIGRVRVLDADAVTSADRWRRDGWFRRSARNLICLAMYAGGVPSERIAAFYSARAP